MNKEAIITGLKTEADRLTTACTLISDTDFFYQPSEKWSIAQNVEHLTKAAKMTRLAYYLPKFIVKVYGGKPNRNSKSYEQLVDKYKQKLLDGGKASGPFVPPVISHIAGKQKIINRYSDSMQKLVRSFSENWKEDQLDQYLAPHPLLGKLTLRELGYFTIYHTIHHHNIINTRLKI